MMSKLRLSLLIGFLIFSFFPGPIQILNVNSQNDNIIIINEPVIEILDLYIDGTGGVFVNLSKDFDFILRLIYHIHFVDNSIDFDNFAGEAAPLTNGFLVFYNDVSLLNGGSAIKANGDFGILAYDVALQSDDKNPIGRIILGRLSFEKINIDGLLINSERTFGIKVQDNITALTSVSEVSVVVEGYKIITEQVYNEVIRGNDILTLFENFWKNNGLSIMSLGTLILGALIVIWFFRKR